MEGPFQSGNSLGILTDSTLEHLCLIEYVMVLIFVFTRTGRGTRSGQDDREVVIEQPSRPKRCK